jgi:hypothetical protein
VTTSEFDDVKMRLARSENKRRLTDSQNTNIPSLRKAGTSSGDDRPTLHRRDGQK